VAGSVLVIDDDPASLRLMAATLDQLQYRTICRSDGLSALQAIETTPPLAVVLDLMMPDMSGFEFLEHFRRHPQHRDIPVIIWTAKDVSAAEQAALRQRAQSVLRKSAGESALLTEELQSLLALRRAAVERV